MVRLIDVSHEVGDGVVTYPGLPAPIVCDFLSREESRSHYSAETTFQIARIDLVANTGTYVDSPFHRFEDGPDLVGLDLAKLADVEGIVRLPLPRRPGQVPRRRYLPGPCLRRGRR